MSWIMFLYDARYCACRSKDRMYNVLFVHFEWQSYIHWTKLNIFQIAHSDKRSHSIHQLVNAIVVRSHFVMVQLSVGSLFFYSRWEYWQLSWEIVPFYSMKKRRFFFNAVSNIQRNPIDRTYQFEFFPFLAPMEGRTTSKHFKSFIR